MGLSAKKPLLIVLCAAATMIPTSPAQACSCGYVTPLKSLGYSDVAFVGTVISREEPPPRFTVSNGDTTWWISGGDMIRYRFVASRGWKGEPFDTVSIYSERDEAACGYMFQPGEAYLVYATAWQALWGAPSWPVGTSFPALSTSLCIGTKPLGSAGGDLAALGTPDWLLDPAPASGRLHQNHPNPFNPVTEIAFELPQHAYTTLRVFDARGRLVRTLLDRVMPAGSFSHAWDGRDDVGRAVSSGVYFYELSSGSFREQRRMALVR